MTVRGKDATFIASYDSSYRRWWGRRGTCWQSGGTPSRQGGWGEAGREARDEGRGLAKIGKSQRVKPPSRILKCRPRWGVKSLPGLVEWLVRLLAFEWEAQ